MEDKVRSLDRALDILEALSEENEPMTLSKISEAVGLSKSTTHRILGTMLNRSFVDKTDSGSYTIGFKIIEMASTHINNLELLTEAKPFLSKIMRELDLTAHLGILDGADVVYLEKLDGHPNSQIYTQIGHRSPGFCSSIGKCLMSGMSSDELGDVLDIIDFKKYTKNTITDRQAFIRHLRQVRIQGWAMDDEEFEIGHRCIGATVYDYRGLPVAAISASGSTTVLSDDKIQETVDKVKLLASQLSRQIGYTG
ncbi:MAG: IclR family transcriptional regulator [Firmicutes bacterium]|nr:IclR family transcriptional regulator [Bacillota bacterium]